MIYISRDMSSYSSLNKNEQMTVRDIGRAYPMSLERIAEIYITLNKNEAATRTRAARECFVKYRIYK